MRVTVEPEARAFIQRNGGHVIVFQAQATGCCGIGSALIPMVEVGRPRKPAESYQTMEQDGITIHVDRALDGTSVRYHIELTGLFGWRSVTLSTQGGSSL